MKMQALVVSPKRTVRYGRPSRLYKAGEIFSAPPKHADLLIALGVAQADAAGVETEGKHAPDIPPRQLVEEAMGISEPPRRRGRPRKVRAD